MTSPKWRTLETKVNAFIEKLTGPPEWIGFETCIENHGVRTTTDGRPFVPTPGRQLVVFKIVDWVPARDAREVTAS